MSHTLRVDGTSYAKADGRWQFLWTQDGREEWVPVPGLALPQALDALADLTARHNAYVAAHLTPDEMAAALAVADAPCPARAEWATQPAPPS